MFLLINLGVGFAALNTGNNLLYLVLSLLLAFLTLSGLLSESALRGIEIRRTLPREIYAGTENPVRLEVRNSQRRVPAFAIVVEDRCWLPHLKRPETPGDWRLDADRDLTVLGRVFALRVGPECTETRSYPLVPEGRGELRFHSVRVSTRFPFGLFLKSRTIFAPGDALVFPAIEAVQSEVPSAGGESSERSTARSRTGSSDVSGLREWEIGDSLRRVHWKSSLRRDRLHVRTQQEDHQAEIEVRLRTRGAGSKNPFENRVSWAASEIVSHLAAGLRVGLLTDSTHLRAEFGDPQRIRLLSFLARVTSDSSGGGENREQARQAPDDPRARQA
jgi:uncharacterized protein (DUF58 family)